jgi:tetratricopeptide (TPR) repeat protein
MVGATGALVRVQDVGAHATVYGLGILRNHAGQHAAAEAAFRRALEIEERLVGVDRPQSGNTMSRIGLETGHRRRFAESDSWFARAEPLIKQDYVPWHYPQHLTHRCIVERLKGNHSESIRYGEEAIGIYEGRRVLSETSYSESLTQTVRAYWAAGRLDEVERGFLKVLTLLDKPGTNPAFRAWRVGEVHHDLGDFYVDRGRFLEARKHLELGLKRREMIFGPSLKIVGSLMALGRLGRLEGSAPRASEAYRRVAGIATKDSAARGALRGDAFEGYFDTLVDSVSAAAYPADLLAAEFFATAQIPRESETAKAMTAMSTRLASADPAVHSATRNYQEAIRRRDRAREANATEQFRSAIERRLSRRRGGPQRKRSPCSRKVFRRSSPSMLG